MSASLSMVASGGMVSMAAKREGAMALSPRLQAVEEGGRLQGTMGWLKRRNRPKVMPILWTEFILLRIWAFVIKHVCKLELKCSPAAQITQSTLRNNQPAVLIVYLLLLNLNIVAATPQCVKKLHLLTPSHSLSSLLCVKLLYVLEICAQIYG